MQVLKALHLVHENAPAYTAFLDLLAALLEGEGIWRKWKWQLGKEWKRIEGIGREGEGREGKGPDQVSREIDGADARLL